MAPARAPAPLPCGRCNRGPECSNLSKSRTGTKPCDKRDGAAHCGHYLDRRCRIWRGHLQSESIRHHFDIFLKSHMCQCTWHRFLVGGSSVDMDPRLYRSASSPNIRREAATKGPGEHRRRRKTFINKSALTSTKILSARGYFLAGIRTSGGYPTLHCTVCY